MSELEREIARTKEEIAKSEKELFEKKAYLAGLEKAHKLQTRAKPEANKLLRPGSSMYQVMEVLKREGAPMHVDKLLTALGKDPTLENKTSLTGSLGSYVRKHQVFTRPSPNTFGLIEFEGESTEAPHFAS